MERRDAVFMFSKIWQDSQKNIFSCCPKCKSTKINERKTKKPKYRCDSCNHDFNEPIGGVLFTDTKEFAEFLKLFIESQD